MSEVGLIEFLSKSQSVWVFLAVVPVAKMLLLLAKASIVASLLSIWILFILLLFLDPKLHYGVQLMIFWSVVLIIGEKTSKFVEKSKFISCQLIISLFKGLLTGVCCKKYEKKPPQKFQDTSNPV
jgi:hypothetical protein